MKRSHRPRVVPQPLAYERMQRGINRLIAAIRPTLGPLPRTVAITRYSSESPEILDDGGTIARRILELPDRGEDIGAMYVRSMLWRLHEEVGDGTATAAVLFGAIYNEGLRYIAAGANPMQLRQYLENGMRVILDQISSMAFPLSGKEALTRLAHSVCNDPPLAEALGEIFDAIGGYGQLEISIGHDRGLEREYQEGSEWWSGVHSRHMIYDKVEQGTRLQNASILITDFSIEDAYQLAPVLETALSAGKQALVIVAQKLSEEAIALLLANSDPARLQVIAVKTPGASDEERRAAIEDLAVLTGGRACLEITGDSLQHVSTADLGGARRVWATSAYFGLIGGKGKRAALRQHVEQLEAAHQRADDPAIQDKIRARIGRLIGGAAFLRVGGSSKTEVEYRQQLARRTARIIRGLLREGAVLGGGATLLACRAPLQRLLDASANLHERVAFQILLRALEEPTRTIIANAGCEPGEWLFQVQQAGEGYGFDARTGQVCDLRKAGIYDVASVQTAAVRGAVTSAALALTVDVLVQHRTPEQVMEPK